MSQNRTGCLPQPETASRHFCWLPLPPATSPLPPSSSWSLPAPSESHSSLLQHRLTQPSHSNIGVKTQTNGAGARELVPNRHLPPPTSTSAVSGAKTWMSMSKNRDQSILLHLFYVIETFLAFRLHFH